MIAEPDVSALGPAVASVFGIGAVQRAPVSPTIASSCGGKSQFPVTLLDRAKLISYGVDVTPLGAAELTVRCGSVMVDVHGVDEDAARRVADWVLDTPFVGEAAEFYAKRAARARGALSPFKFVSFVAHNRGEPSSSGSVVVDGDWHIAEPELIKEPITDSSAKAMMTTAQRAVSGLLPGLRGEVFVLVISPTLPLVEELAPHFWRLLRKSAERFVWRENVAAAAAWPSSVLEQLNMRLPTLPTHASWCTPKREVLFLFGVRGDGSNFAAAHAIARSVKKRAPKADLPTLLNARRCIAWDQLTAPGPNWVCLLQDGGSLDRARVDLVLEFTRKSTSVRVVDLCGASGVTIDDVRNLAAMPHVAVIGIVGTLPGCEKQIAQLDASVSKLVWMSERDAYERDERDAVFQRHATFFPWVAQARAVWEKECFAFV